MVDNYFLIPAGQKVEQIFVIIRFFRDIFFVIVIEIKVTINFALILK